MNIEMVCRKRTINRIGIQTPLLVPSFSSVHTENIKEIHGWIRGQITMASLVSAYDLYYNFIDSDRIWASDVVFIDSGKYEYDALTKRGTQKDWSSEIHIKTIDNLTPLTKLVLIGYDIKDSILVQIDSALHLYSEFPDHAICFLYRPLSVSSIYVDISTFISNVPTLKQFDVLGFTEKELGVSLLERCKNIKTIRDCLNSNGFDTPIHIFGCLDPLCIISYFICGADIFDGLSWLRFGFHNSVALYINNYSIYKRYWSDSDARLRDKTFVFNISELERLSRCMKQFANEHSFDVFRIDKEALESIKDLIESAGIEF